MDCAVDDIVMHIQIEQIANRIFFEWDMFWFFFLLKELVVVFFYSLSSFKIVCNKTLVPLAISTAFVNSLGE